MQQLGRAEPWIRGAERLSRALGSVSGWSCALMVALGAFNAVARYLGRFIGVELSSNAYIELQWYLFSAVFLLGASAALADDAHVRVDVLYSRLSARGRDWIDLAGTVFFLIPFCAACIAVSWPAVHNSWAILESSPDPGGLPRYPIKTLIPLALGVVLLQGAACGLRAALRLFGGGAGVDPRREPGS